MSNFILSLTPTPTPLHSSQLAPVELAGAFEDDDLLCLFHDLAPIDGSSDGLSPVAPYGAYTRRNGLVSKAELTDLCPEAHLAIAQVAGSLRPLSPFTYAAQEMDRDFNTLFRIHYYRSCSIVTWADFTYAESFLKEASEDEDYGLFEPEAILCSVYMSNPESNHMIINNRQRVERDIHTHIDIMRSQGLASISLNGVTFPLNPE